MYYMSYPYEKLSAWWVVYKVNPRKRLHTPGDAAYPLEAGEVDEVYQDDELPCSFNIDLDSALNSLLGDANDVTVPEERVQELSKKKKHKIFNVLDILYYVFATYSLVLVFNRMSKKLKAVSKKLFGRKSKTGPEDTLFRGSTLGSSRRDEIMKYIDPTLMGQTICYQRSEVILIF